MWAGRASGWLRLVIPNQRARGVQYCFMSGFPESGSASSLNANDEAVPIAGAQIANQNVSPIAALPLHRIRQYSIETSQELFRGSSGFDSTPPGRWRKAHTWTSKRRFAIASDPKHAAKARGIDG
jgi:hypothetical protein